MDILRPPDLYADETDKGETISVIGTVSDRYRKNNSWILELHHAGIHTAAQNSKQLKTHGVLVYLKDPEEPLPKLGSDVLVRGRKELFSSAANPGQFDYRMAEAVRGMDYCLFDAEILRTGKRCNLFLEGNRRLKDRLGKIYEEVLDEEDAGVCKAMTLGERNGLDSEIRDLYRRAGIAHVLSISGLHISLLGFGLLKLLKALGLRPKRAALFSMLSMAGYCILTGCASSTVRACAMFSLCALSEWIGRTYDLLSALSLVFVLMLSGNLKLIHDSGFVLSFTAVLGIALVEPLFRTELHLSSRKKWAEVFLSGLRAALSVNLMTLPVTAVCFFQFPLYSPILNLLLIPFMGLLLSSAFLTALTGALSPALAFLPAKLCHVILLLYERGCITCETIPGSMLTIGRPSVPKLLVYYVLLALILLAGKRISSRRTGKIAVIIAVMVLPAVLMLRTGGELEITALDIGQGDCIYLHTPGSLTMLIDCGSSSETSIARYRVIPFIRSRGVDTIDYCFVTHTDADHINGFEELFSMKEAERVRIRCLVLPSIGDPDRAYHDLETAAEEAGCQVAYLSAGQEFSDGKAVFRCLHPSRGFQAEDKNTESVVMELKYGDFSAVFTGDVQEEGEELAGRALEGPVTLLKVAHHGSKNSSTEEFLSRAAPRLAVISCGEGNRYHHPHPEALERIRHYTGQIYTTAECGAVTLLTKNGRTLRLSAFRKLDRVRE